MDVRLLESRPSRMLWAVAKRVDTLTPRERQVLALVVRGVSNTNFAAVLGVREKSIEVNRSRAVKKMGAKNVSELVQRVRTMSRLSGDHTQDTQTYADPCAGQQARYLSASFGRRIDGTVA